MLEKLTGCLLFALFYIPMALAEIREESWQFRFYNSTNGLSQNTVNAIAQDQHGFIWVGTQFGINRFDGYEFDAYTRPKNIGEKGLRSNLVSALVVDNNNHVWAGTGDGVQYYSAAVNDFLSLPETPDVISGVLTESLTMGHENDLWLGNQNGLFRLDTQTKTVEQSYFKGLVVTDTLIADGVIMVVVNRELLVSLDLTTGEQQVMFASSGTEIIQSLVYTTDNNLLIGTSRRLVRLAGDSIEVLFEEEIQNVISMTQDTAGRIWLGTDSDVFLVSADFIHAEKQSVESQGTATLTNQQINNIFTDRRSLIWFGTQSSGLFLHNPKTEWLSSLRHVPGAAFSVISKSVSAVAAIDRNEVWHGGSQGIARTNWAQKTTEYFYASDETGVESTNIYSLFIDSNENLWVGYRPGSLGLYSRATNTFKSVSPELNVFTTHINELSDGRLLLMTRNHGFYLYTPKTNGLRQISSATHKTRGIVSDRFQHSFIDHAGRLWLGSFDSGLMLFDLASETVTERYTSDPTSDNSIASNLIVSMHQTADKGMWIGTNAGLSYFDFQSKSFSNLTLEDGLPDETIYDILTDNQQNLWLPTNQGMVVYNPTDNRFRQFTTEDGLPDDEFNSNAHVMINDVIYSGGIGGMVRFDLKNTPPEHEEVETRLINLFMRGEEIVSSLNPDNLSEPLINASHLNIGYKDKAFSLFFSALEFETPLKLRYRYRLSPFDNDWRQVNAQRRVATYTNLDSGDYRFEVQASTVQGKWGPPRTLSVFVEPHPLNSFWAYTAYVSIVLAIIGYISFLIVQRQQIRAQSYSQLEAKERQLSFALWGSGDELWNIDLQNGLLIRQNKLPEACYEEKQAWNANFDNSLYTHPEDSERVTAAIERCLKGVTDSFQETYRIKHKDGGWFWVLDKGKVSEFENGKPARLSGSIKNIDKLKQAEEELALVNAELENRVKERTLVLQLTNKELTETVDQLKSTQGQLVEAEKMASLGSMVAGISHEINTPLGVALTAITHVNEASQDLFDKVESNSLTQENYVTFKSELSNGIELALRNLTRSGELIASFKQVSVDQSAEQRRQFELNALFTDTMRMMHPKLKSKHHTIHLQCPKGISMDSYPGALSQIVINLIDNSITHGFKSNANGIINIEVTENRHKMVIVYSDNGCGIAKDNLPNIFAPFFTTNRAKGNTGLGMHISYNLVTQKLKGTIRVESMEDHGVRFVVELPSSINE